MSLRTLTPSRSDNLNRLQLDGRRIENLVRQGIEKFHAAGIYISPSKMSKLVRDAARKHGYAWAKVEIDRYFEHTEKVELASYVRALGGASNFTRVGRAS
ncbi:hypothetical protein [Agromyces sp. NPDC057865]|uniref:hypothetical protein n=1 Tax=Agromyces sp. NPDC057865 TaxID=3346267 RepID=UPI00366DAB6F